KKLLKSDKCSHSFTSAINMIDLLIAILIALGCDISSGKTADQLKAEDPENYSKAIEIIDNEQFRCYDGGGVVTWD
ncbi:MAG: hypothetical protein ACO3O0_09765, partial [Bacteroidia bacterium]